MSIDIYPKKPTHEVVEFYIAKARKMRAEALRNAGRHIAEDIRGIFRGFGGRHA